MGSYLKTRRYSSCRSKERYEGFSTGSSSKPVKSPSKNANRFPPHGQPIRWKQKKTTELTHDAPHICPRNKENQGCRQPGTAIGEYDLRRKMPISPEMVWYIPSPRLKKSDAPACQVSHWDLWEMQHGRGRLQVIWTPSIHAWIRNGYLCPFRNGSLAGEMPIQLLYWSPKNVAIATDGFI